MEKLFLIHIQMYYNMYTVTNYDFRQSCKHKERKNVF